MIRKHFYLGCLGFMLILSPSILWAAESVDGAPGVATQRHDMHSCSLKAGTPALLTYVSGIDVGRNLLLCQDSPLDFGQNFPPTNESVDGDNEPPTQESGMHACPRKQAVTGVHVNNNWLACAPYFAANDPSLTEEVRLDPSRSWLCNRFGWFCEAATQRKGMHACREGEVVKGIHVENNILLCGKVYKTL